MFSLGFKPFFLGFKAFVLGLLGFSPLLLCTDARAPCWLCSCQRVRVQAIRNLRVQAIKNFVYKRYGDRGINVALLQKTLLTVLGSLKLVVCCITATCNQSRRHVDFGWRSKAAQVACSPFSAEGCTFAKRYHSVCSEALT